MANAQIEGLNLFQPLINLQGEMELVPFSEYDRRLQEGYRRPDPGPDRPDPYLQLLEEDAARGANTPTFPRPELPRPFNIDYRSDQAPPAPTGPGAGSTFQEAFPELGMSGLYRPELFPRSEQLPTGESRIIDPTVSPPVREPRPDELTLGAPPPSRNIFDTFRPTFTETSPDGTVRLLPHVAQPFNQNERDVIEGYLNAFQPPPPDTSSLTGTPAPTGTRGGTSSQAPRFYQYYGDVVRPEGGGTPYILRPDGTRETQVPPGGAYQASTGRVYQQRPGTDIGYLSEYYGIRNPGEALTEALISPLHDLGRAAERIELGLHVPDRQLFSEALNIQGLLVAGTSFGRLGSIARGAGGTGEHVLSAEGARPPPPRPEMPPARREVEGPPLPEVGMTPGGTMYRTVRRPVEPGPAPGELPGARPPPVNIDVTGPNRMGQFNGTIRNAAGEDVGSFYARSVRTSADAPRHFQIGRIEMEPEIQRRGLYQAIRDHIEATTGMAHIPDSTLSGNAYRWWQRQDPEAVRGLYRRMGDDDWIRRDLVPNVVPTPRIKRIHEAFARGELRSPIGQGGRITRRPTSKPGQLYANPDEPAAAGAASAAAHLTRETDRAGFYLPSLEALRRPDTPERLTPRQVRDILDREGVTTAERHALGIEDALLGPVGVARREHDAAVRNLGRIANEHGQLARKARDTPLGDYPRQLQELSVRMGQARNEERVLRNISWNAERDHIRSAIRDFRAAEARHKEASNAVRMGPRYLRDIEPLLAERRKTFQALEEARRELAARAEFDPENRVISRQEIIDHIRSRRPDLDTHVRRFPEGTEGVYGDISAGIARIRHGGPLRERLRAIGLDDTLTDYLVRELGNAAPHHWPNNIAAVNNHLYQRGRADRALADSGAVKAAVEEVVGAPMSRIVSAARPPQGDTARPRYRWAIPDQDNPTQVEQAITLRGRFQYGSGHWVGVDNPVAHMHISVQRLPMERAGVGAKTQKRLDDLNQERFDLATRLHDNRNPVPPDELMDLVRRLSNVEKQVEKTERKLPNRGPSEEMTYLGNQFQSDWSVDAARANQVRQAIAAGDRAADTPVTPPHPLGPGTRDWLRPVLDDFVDQAIGSGLKSFAIPSGETVRRYNPMMSTTVDFYNSTVRKELDYVLRRRGLPTAHTNVDRMYPAFDTYGNPRGYNGSWDVYRIPEGARRGKQLYSNPDEPAAAAAGSTAAQLTRLETQLDAIRKGRDIDPTLYNAREWRQLTDLIIEIERLRGSASPSGLN